MWDLGSPTRNRTRVPSAVEAQSLNHWTAREVPINYFKSKEFREFPGGPVVRTRSFHCWGPGSIPGQGTKIPQAAQCGQEKKKKKKDEEKSKEFKDLKY